MRTKLLAITLLPLLIIKPVYGEEGLPTDFKSTEVNAAVQKLPELETSLRAISEARMHVARKELIEQLRAYQVTATKSGDLDEALKIRGAIEQLEKLQAAYEKATTVAPSIRVQIPQTAVKLGKSHYFVVTAPMSLTDAQKYCAERGGHLVRISSEEEHTLCAKLIKPLQNNKGDMRLARIDGNDVAERDKYVFGDGTSVTYIRWDKDKPIANDRCRYLMLYSPTGLYHNGIDDAKRPCPFICEWD